MSAASVLPRADDPPCCHASAEEYARFVGRRGLLPVVEHQLLGDRERFARAYPDLSAWFAAPLAERVGRLYRETVPTSRVCYKARPYLYFLAVRGYARFDWEWLVAVLYLDILDVLAPTPLPGEVAGLVEELVALGYERAHATQALRWCVSRIVMHTGRAAVAAADDEQRHGLAEAVRRFGERPDAGRFFGSPERFRDAVKRYGTHLHTLHVALYHRGQTAEEPRRVMPPYGTRPALPPRMADVIARYLARRRLTDRPNTVEHLDRSLHKFAAWLTREYPAMDTLAGVTREHVLAFAGSLDTTIVRRTGQPLAPLTRRGDLSCLSVFFRDTATWGWEDVPGRPLFGAGDLPKVPQRVPRYIPEDELARLMAAVRQLTCPYQRAALLIARWSGARRDEIVRLEVDCLDSYPDGTPRLRIPAGKTKRERLVPLNEEAAAAIRAVQADRRGERGFRDDLTGLQTRYLFMRFGKPAKTVYLFDRALSLACAAAGLTRPDGTPTVTAHRFRHTVGTQLAERGAKLHTIMAVLGHTSLSMTMVYAQISDREVLKDYQTVLGPGATIAGPYAEALRSGELAPSAVEWLQDNFFKTELELGHCLRLPEEGPCECDLYLTCAKFVTTPEYAPRLRERRRRELALVDDAVSHGWLREVERHRCTAGRIEQLLADLDVPLEAPETPA